MTSKLLDRIGDWNPQLFRELKGYSNPVKIYSVIIGSFISQFLVFMPLVSQKCIEYDRGICVQSEWLIYWEVIFRILDWMLPLTLLVGGVYVLVGDLAKEERQGTFNFIRLSPQSSQSILLGKTLGVPALLFLAIVLAIPLHFIAGLASDRPFLWILASYTFWGIGCCLFYWISLLYGLLYSKKIEPKSLAGTVSLVAFLLALPYISAVDFSFDWYKANLVPKNWQWFFLPVGSQPELAYCLMIITIAIASYWFWQAVNRRFCNPKAPLLSKKQSYWLVASWQIFLLGFALTNFNLNNRQIQDLVGFSFLFFLNPIFFVLLSVALVPDRQSVLDWTRYRRETVSTKQSFWKSSLLQDLIWDERSPAVVAIGINYLLATAIWLPWILLIIQTYLFENSETILMLLAGLVLSMNAILIYALLPEFKRFLKPQHRWFLVLTVLGMILFPIVSWKIMGSSPIGLQILLLFSPFPVFSFVFNSIPTLLLGFVAQITFLGFFGTQLTRQLKQAGETETKAMLTGH